jgi:hypothetical protein
MAPRTDGRSHPRCLYSTAVLRLLRTISVVCRFEGLRRLIHNDLEIHFVELNMTTVLSTPSAPASKSPLRSGEAVSNSTLSALSRSHSLHSLGTRRECPQLSVCRMKVYGRSASADSSTCIECSETLPCLFGRDPRTRKIPSRHQRGNDLSSWSLTMSGEMTSSSLRDDFVVMLLDVEDQH